MDTALTARRVVIEIQIDAPKKMLVESATKWQFAVTTMLLALAEVDGDITVTARAVPIPTPRQPILESE